MDEKGEKAAHEAERYEASVIPEARPRRWARR